MSAPPTSRGHLVTDKRQLVEYDLPPTPVTRQV